MNVCNGLVERIEGEYAWVRAEGTAHACGSCLRRDGCGAAGLDSSWLPAAPQRLLKLPNPIGARPGDQVLIRVEDGSVLRAVWHVYGIPLLLALASALLAKALGAEEGATLLAVGLGLAVGFWALRRLDSRQRAPIFSIEFKKPT